MQACALSQQLQRCLDEEQRAVCDFGFGIMQQVCLTSCMNVPEHRICLLKSTAMPSNDAIAHMDTCLRWQDSIVIHQLSRLQQCGAAGLCSTLEWRANARMHDQCASRQCMVQADTEILCRYCRLCSRHRWWWGPSHTRSTCWLSPWLRLASWMHLPAQ